QVISIDSRNSTVYGLPDKVIALIGVEDLVVVDTEDALLVMPKDQAQRVKEIIELPEGRADRGRVIQTMGFPFKGDSVGGTWIYYMGNNMVSIGLVTPLDYRDPFVDPHEQLQLFKEHPHIRKILEGGKSVGYGAKVISAGGYYSIPKLHSDGALIVGEAGSLVDMARLKGIHLAMKSGMIAADTILSSLRSNDFSAQALSSYDDAIRESYVGKQLWRTRNYHRALSMGMPRAFFHLGLQQITGGADFLRYDNVEEDRYTLSSVAEYYGEDRELPEPRRYDGKLSLDKLANVYNSGTMHNEDQPSHLKVPDTSLCYDTCVSKYRYPCNRFCPTNVYEMITVGDSGKLQLQINFANCVHCQTCDIKCPLDNIQWTPPEGGDGPNYVLL
ncbi:MAG: 4Fe-4S dicluster domain-containing protein, partial [Candidatus Krumholzibacteriota bacterium]|nr:4Fe-4S dicluster domain-containing protein [Candidatus Krumholzibacteriota bacterium]